MRSASGAQFTCFPSAKVQTLTQQRISGVRRATREGPRTRALSPALRYQALSLLALLVQQYKYSRSRAVSEASISVYLLY